MLGNRSWADWIAQYETSHRHPFNRAGHTVGIPSIALSLAILPALVARPRWWPAPASLFVFGWALQFLGHAVEGKPPEFFRDYRFLFVGLRWWAAKVRREQAHGRQPRGGAIITGIDESSAPGPHY